MFKDLKCPKPNFTLSGSDKLIVNKNISKEFKHFEQIGFECALNYELVGDSTVMCLPDGTWSSNFPTCKSNKHHFKKYRFILKGIKTNILTKKRFYAENRHYFTTQSRITQTRHR